MANLSNYAEEIFLNHVFRDESISLDGNYLGLVSSSATDEDLENGDLTDEITGYDGDRKSASYNSAYQSEGKGTIENDGNIDFENMPNEEIGYVILCDSATKGSGNIIIWAPADSVKTANEGDTYRIQDGQFTTQID